MEDDLRKHILKAQKGDHAAFKAIYQEFSVRLLPLIMRWVLSSHDLSESDGDDISQATWLKVWENLPSFRMDCSFSSWAFKIAHNEFVQRFREVKRRRQGGRILFDELNDNYRSYDPQYEGDWAIKCLKEFFVAVRSLPFQYSEPYIHFITGATYKQISYFLGRPEGTVGWQISSARKKIKDRLSKNLGISNEEVVEVIKTALNSPPNFMDYLVMEDLFEKLVVMKRATKKREMAKDPSD